MRVVTRMNDRPDLPESADIPGFTAATLRVRAELSNGQSLAALETGPYAVSVIAAAEALWVVIRRPGRGGVAMRALPPSGPMTLIREAADARGGVWAAQTASGVFTVAVSLAGERLVRVETTLTPAADLLVPFWPRDLYPLDTEDDPRATRGQVEAGQRGLNAGLCYLCITEPRFGSVLYLQDLTRLNDFYRATEGKPDGVVGGAWPELGMEPAPAPLAPLPAGVPVVISDAYLALSEALPTNEVESAALFVDLLGQIYPHLEKKPPAAHDWAARAARTLRDLTHAPGAHVTHYGHFYLRPYLDAEYPDCMAQLAVTRALFEYARATGRTVPLVEKLFAGMEKFYDADLGTLRRYLPNVGADKNRDAVDSWYLYHPLLNLGAMALAGHEGAEALFRRALDYAIRAAGHFEYTWPILFDVRTFEVIEPAREPKSTGLGQTDVGGVYAYVMLQAHALTGEARYLEEAKAALGKLRALRFDLVYQANLTAWGAVACAKLHRLEPEEGWLAQSDVFIAGFLNNCVLWNSDLRCAAHYPTFFGATCLHDAPYMAAFECYECFAAFEEYLHEAGEAARGAVRLLLQAYTDHALDRAHYFYPDALPNEAIAQSAIRNGHIDRTLSFPLEDLYADGQPAGQVGQEIYGAGMAFAFAASLARRARGAAPGP